MVWPCVLPGDVTSSTELAAGPVQIFTVAGGRREEGILRVLIIGGGGREHALAWKIAQSPLLGRLYCAPGNAGIAALARCVDLPVDDLEGICKFALDKRIDLAVIGPEAPLAAGLADRLREAGLKAFGPSEEGARLESSKIWAKERMSRWGIPTAEFAVFDDYEAAQRHLERRYRERPVVVKADGLAAGKGVVVAPDRLAAEEALRQIMIEKVFGASGERVILEECLYGEELSILAITGGERLVILPSSQDHKAIGEGDRGPNTGGMGAYAPAPLLTDELAHEVERQVFRPFLKGLQAEGIDYRGVIYAGLMIGRGQINLLEFNVRFGDPETQAILPLIRSDLLPLLLAAAEGSEDAAAFSADLPLFAGSAATVVLASEGYPGVYATGKAIRGLKEAARPDGGFDSEKEGLALFHAGTAFNDSGAVVTSGGRVLGVTAWAGTLPAALQFAYRSAEQIDFDGCYYRRDIGHRALKR